MEHNIAEDIYEKPFDWRMFVRIGRYVLPYKPDVALIIITLMGSSLSYLSMPYLWKVSIDKYILKGNFNGLIWVAALYFAFRGVSWFSSYWHEYLMARTGQQISRAVRQDIFDHLQRLSMKFFDRHKVGWLMARLTSDINAIEEFCGYSIAGFADMLFTLCVTVGLMLSLNVRLSLITFLIVPPLAVVSMYFGRKARLAYRRSRITNTDLVISLAENINGVRVTQSFVREEVNRENFKKVNSRNYEANIETAAISAVYMPFISLIGAGGTLLILWFGGASVISGGVSIGVLVAFMGYIDRFFQPVRTLSELYNHMLNAMASGERIFGLIDTPVLIADHGNSRDAPQINGNISFKNVWFAYEKEKYVLRDISFTVKPGQTVALVGPTGAGKSSIMSLVARFYDYNKGSITVEGMELKDITLNSLRRQTGIVLQDNFLFEGTIRDNIRYGRLEATDDEVEHAAQLTGAHEFIESFPEKYLTNVREQGNRLSVGQKQLISFSRALLRDPRILILDEATSSIDAYMEYKIQVALKKLLKGRVCFVAAHRLSTIKNADLILVVENGTIAEQGTHTELLNKGGIYRNFYETRFRYVRELEE